VRSGYAGGAGVRSCIDTFAAVLGFARRGHDGWPIGRESPANRHGLRDDALELDREREDEPFVVVRVVAHEVDAPGRAEAPRRPRRLAYDRLSHVAHSGASSTTAPQPARASWFMSVLRRSRCRTP
jgi:hypothetical protein